MMARFGSEEEAQKAMLGILGLEDCVAAKVTGGVYNVCELLNTKRVHWGRIQAFLLPPVDRGIPLPDGCRLVEVPVAFLGTFQRGKAAL